MNQDKVRKSCFTALQTNKQVVISIAIKHDLPTSS